MEKVYEASIQEREVAWGRDTTFVAILPLGHLPILKG